MDDHIDSASRDWVTLDEDGRIVRTEAHEARATELGLHVESWRSAQAFDAEQARWAGLIGNRIRDHRTAALESRLPDGGRRAFPGAAVTTGTVRHFENTGGGAIDTMHGRLPPRRGGKRPV